MTGADRRPYLQQRVWMPRWQAWLLITGTVAYAAAVAVELLT